ncbi:MAG: matrixin family metalloprotease [Candidatus Solibacter sp.]
MRFTRIARIAAIALALGVPAQAYYHYVHYVSGGRTGPFNIQQEKFNVPAGGTVSFFVNDRGPAVYAPGDSFGSLLGQVKQALAAWDSVSSPNLRVAFGGLETDGQVSNAPGGDVVFQDLPPGLYGMGGPTSNGTTIVRGTVILSNDTSGGAGPSYLENFFTTAVHEVGHALGLQHTWTGSAMSQDVLRNTSRAKPFDADDVAAINMLYGAAGWQNNFGSMAGTVRFANGTPVTLASVVAVSPTGAAVSSLTNPDGTYRIDGIPAGNYLLYVHPLPPDAVPSDGTGLRPPTDQNGGQFLPNGVFATVFYPNTIDPRQATSFTIAAGNVTFNQNFNVQARSGIPAYDLITASFLDPRTKLPLYDTSNVAGPIQVWPAIVNNTLASLFVKVEANSGDTPIPQSATLLGGFGVASGDYLRSYTDDRTGRRALAIYWGMPPFAGTGPRHLVLNYGNDIFVMPQAINLVRRPAPAISSVRGNSDGSVTVTGTNLSGDSVVYFDGIQAVRSSAFSGNDLQGVLTVTPPAGMSEQPTHVIVYNGDGQNTTFTKDPLPTYVYPGSGTPQLQRIDLTSLTAGATGLVDITAQNTAFVDGQVAVGFGSGDIIVKRVWVLSPNRLQANIAVAENAAAGTSEVSVISGFQVLSQTNAFQVLPKNSTLPVISAVSNAISAQQTIYPGGFVTIYGSNLASIPGNVQVTLGDQPMTLQPGGVLPGQVNFFIPAGFPAGVAILRLNNGVTSATPIAAPAIQSVTNASGVTYDVSHPAAAQDVVNVFVSNLDPSAASNPTRVQVTMNGRVMALQSLTPAANGQTQITFVVTQGFGGAMVNLTVVVDGSSSAPYALTVR